MPELDLANALMSDPYLTPEANKSLENNDITIIAAQVRAGTRHYLPIKARINVGTAQEEEIFVLFKTPDLGAESRIAARVAMMTPRVVMFDDLPQADQIMLRARATFEELQVGNLPDWCPKGDDGRPDTSRVIGRERMVNLLFAYIGIAGRFQ